MRHNTPNKFFPPLLEMPVVGKCEVVLRGEKILEVKEFNPTILIPLAHWLKQNDSLDIYGISISHRTRDYLYTVLMY